MEATKTEKLADVLRDLAELAPSRFTFKEATGVFPVGVKPHLDGMRQLAFLNLHEETKAQILLACTQECESHGWGWITGTDDGTEWRYIAILTVDGEYQTHYADCPVVVLAVALRDALRASRSMPSSN